MAKCQGLKTALAMSMAADRNVRAVMLANLPKAIELNKSDPRNWETEVDKIATPGFLKMLENILEMLEEAQETAP